ncbi:hypothetical protein N0M98_28740 [Paenibacillus doosanensis]|nr:hypothetical protein [Paenibacillus doosanensis]
MVFLDVIHFKIEQDGADYQTKPYVESVALLKEERLVLHNRVSLVQVNARKATPLSLPCARSSQIIDQYLRVQAAVSGRKQINREAYRRQRQPPSKQPILITIIGNKLYASLQFL